MPRALELILGGLLAVVFGFAALARRMPHVTWLEPFRRMVPRMSEEQAARIRRRANVHAGVEMILLGLALPLLYVAATVMFFSEFTATAVTLVVLGSLALIALGGVAIWHGVRRVR